MYIRSICKNAPGAYIRLMLYVVLGTRGVEKEDTGFCLLYPKKLRKTLYIMQVKCD